MKVLVISHMYPSLVNEVGGIFVHEQVKALTKLGAEVRVISPIPWSPWPLSCIKARWRAFSRVPFRDILENVEVYHPRYIVFPKAWFFNSSGLRMYQGIRNLVKVLYQEFPFEIIHAHVALPDGHAGVMLSQEFQKPLIVTIHGQDLQQTVHKDETCRKAAMYVMKHANKVIVVSRQLWRLAEELLGDGSKCTVIHNGVDAYKIEKAKNVEDLPLTADKVVLSVSSLIRRKGIDFNIYAVQKLVSKYPDLQYWIVGSGPERTRLQNLVNQLGLGEKVRFLGLQPHGHALRYMAACTIFSLPSWNEAFGVVYIEAMALGKPVIGCQGEGPEDFIEHGKTGLLVKPRDVDSLVEALDFLLSHPEEAQAMGERARRVVLANYTWEKSAKKLMEVYREVLER